MSSSTDWQSVRPIVGSRPVIGLVEDDAIMGESLT